VLAVCAAARCSSSLDDLRLGEWRVLIIAADRFRCRTRPDHPGYPCAGGLSHGTCHERATLLHRLREAGMAIEAIQPRPDTARSTRLGSIYT